MPAGWARRFTRRGDPDRPLVTLATVHVAAVASLLGPVHGCACLFVLGATLRESRDLRTRCLAAVPGVGGQPAVRRIKEVEMCR